VFSSLGEGEGEEVVEEEEDEATGEEDEDDVVVVAIIDKDDEPVEVIPVPESTPPRSLYKQTTRIRIGPRDQPTRTLALREGATQAGRTPQRLDLPCGHRCHHRLRADRSPPCPHHHRAMTQEPCRHHKIPPPPASNHHSGAPSGVESFTASPTSRNRAAWVIDRGLGIFLTGLEGHAEGDGVGGGVERRGAMLVCCAGEAHRGGGGKEVGNRRMFLEVVMQERRVRAGWVKP
jgi:hypothetical protein